MMCSSCLHSYWYTRVVLEALRLMICLRSMAVELFETRLAKLSSLWNLWVQKDLLKPWKKLIESQFQDKHIVYCSHCNMVRHDRKICRNLVLSWLIFYDVLLFGGTISGFYYFHACSYDYVVIFMVTMDVIIILIVMLFMDVDMINVVLFDDD